MERTFEITKREFYIWRYALTGWLVTILFLVFFVILPVSAPYIYCIGLPSTSKDITTGIALSALVFICCSIPPFFAAVSEKSRLPISINLKNDFLMVGDKTGKQWAVRYSACRHTLSFIRYCLSGPLFMGTWDSGVTIYVPRDSLKGFPEGHHDMAPNAPEATAFHISIKMEDVPEIISFLEKHNCKQVMPPTSIQLLTAAFAPSLFIWTHFFIALFLFNQIGCYGVVGSLFVGYLSGGIVAYSAIRIDYLRRRRFDIMRVYAMIVLSIGVPIFLWNVPQGIPELQPSCFGAFFVVLLCWIESYIWLYCFSQQGSMY